MRTRSVCRASALLVLLSATSTAAQLPTFRSTVNGVVVNVFVNAGKIPVDGLTAADFVLLDNGVRQTVDAVPADRVPIDVSLVLETSALVAEHIGRFKEVVREVGANLRPVDRVRLILCGARVQEVWPMTPPSALPLTNLRVMDDLATRGPRFAATATDALVEAMVRAGEPGRRHLVIAFTKYVGQGEAIVSPAALVPIARRTEAVLYLGTLPDRAPYPPDFFRFAGEAAAATGGQLLLGTAPQPTGDIYDSYQFDSLKPDLGGGTIVPYSDMVKAFAQVIYDFRRSYLLSYTPEGVSREGWHDITVKVAQPASGQYTVRARKGYSG